MIKLNKISANWVGAKLDLIHSTEKHTHACRSQATDIEFPKYLIYVYVLVTCTQLRQNKKMKNAKFFYSSDSQPS